MGTILKYAWDVFIHIATIAIVLAIFSITTSQFETIVLAVLILIYLSVESFISLWGMFQVTLLDFQNNQFRAIKRLLQKDVLQTYEAVQDFSQTEPDEELEELIAPDSDTAVAKVANDNTIKTRRAITTVFQVITYMITVYKLLATIYNF